MRKWLLWAHTYLGLAFFGFLIIFGFSSICMNHGFAFLQGWTDQPMRRLPVTIAAGADPAQAAADIAHQTGVVGRILNPRFSKSGSLDFGVYHPGGRYSIHFANGMADIYKSRQNWAAVLVDLHGVRPSTNSIVLNAWAWFCVAGATVLAVSAVSGILIWSIRPREKLLGWTLLIGGVVVSFVFCGLICWWG